MKLPKSKLNSTSNVKKYGPFPGSDQNETVYVMVRYDDTCGNGHNSLGITCTIYDKGRWAGGGCNHDIIAEVMPEIEYLIKWHLMSTDGPMHYIGNTLYHAGDKDYNGLRKGKAIDLDAARRSAVWPDAELKDLTEENLNARLPELMQQFKADIERAGFEY